jgi:two-component system alkaline phosphatase synthesis response regulator PhoP
MSARILVVEDERALRIALSDRLNSEGYTVECSANGEEGFQKAIGGGFSLIILDVMLPRKNGLDVCRDIRAAGLVVPIVILTARSQMVDKVLGLKIGADDYITKPFEMIELLARVEAQLRNPRGSPEAPAIREFGALHVDLQATLVRKDGQIVQLSAREFQLLRYFVQHPDTTLSRDVLLKEVWGYSSETFTRTIDVHIARLRQKIEKDPQKPSLLVTVPGLGYKFSP